MDDHGAQLKKLSKIVTTVETKGGGSDDLFAIKVEINLLKMEVASLKSTDISSLWDSLDMPSRVDINVAPKGIIGVDVPGEGIEGVNVSDSLETNKEALGVNPH